ncbi:hypothetical protein [Nocardia carnea]|nr:hypothetical protein [Nocardia carnea]
MLALVVSDRAIVLDRGRMVLSGAAGQLRTDREKLTAAYFGSAGIPG